MERFPCGYGRGQSADDARVHKFSASFRMVCLCSVPGCVWRTVLQRPIVTVVTSVDSVLHDALQHPSHPVSFPKSMSFPSSLMPAWINQTGGSLAESGPVKLIFTEKMF